MSLNKSIAGKYKVGREGRNKSPSSLIIGCLYEAESVYGILIGYEDGKAMLRLKDGEVKEFEKKSLKIVVL